MKERNQKQRRHIRAARQWLGEAEHSLAENHRVRGELKVMLAKAELARVEGTPGHRFVKKWSMRILPALAAIFLAGGGYALWQAQLPHNAAVPAPVETEAPEPSPALPAETADEPPLAPIEIPEQAQPAAAPAQAAPAPSPEPVPAQAAAPSEAQPGGPARGSAARVPPAGGEELWHPPRRPPGRPRPRGRRGRRRRRRPGRRRPGPGGRRGGRLRESPRRASPMTGCRN